MTAFYEITFVPSRSAAAFNSMGLTQAATSDWSLAAALATVRFCAMVSGTSLGPGERARLMAVDFCVELYQNDIMRLIGQDVLSKAVRKHADAKKWLDAWVATVEDASWQSLDDVRADYPSADGVKLKSRVVVTVFNAKGNEYRLLTNISYKAQAVLVLELMTHGAYDKEQRKERY